MFKKILISEDFESANLSVQKTLEELNIQNIDCVYYCDDALGRVKKALRYNEPYDLLITDLYYEEDHNEQKIKDGRILIERIREEQPNLKIIVFSAEHKSAIIDSLFSEYEVNGYVRKARNDSKELKKAITAVYNNKNYLSLDLKEEVKKLNTYEFSSYDINIVSLLSQGVLQKNIPTYFKSNNIKPSSLSSIEKRLSLLKQELQVNSNQQLVAFFKDLGII
ncbi:response regulator [Chryseobacterium sp.]|uniref:response regulator n=1 Tax=Chryseobacterium sp. TaxID=1871047 RepID=UPI0025BE7F35|nr:response regulator [Chryseobacterium sp.]